MNCQDATSGQLMIPFLLFSWEQKPIGEYIIWCRHFTDMERFSRENELLR